MAARETTFGRRMGMPLRARAPRDPGRTAAYPWLRSFAMGVAAEVENLGEPRTPPRESFDLGATELGVDEWLAHVPSSREARPEGSAASSGGRRERPLDQLPRDTGGEAEQRHRAGEAPRVEPPAPATAAQEHPAATAVLSGESPANPPASLVEPRGVTAGSGASSAAPSDPPIPTPNRNATPHGDGHAASQEGDISLAAQPQGKGEQPSNAPGPASNPGSRVVASAPSARRPQRQAVAAGAAVRPNASAWPVSAKGLPGTNHDTNPSQSIGEARPGPTAAGVSVMGRPEGSEPQGQTFIEQLVRTRLNAVADTASARPNKRVHIGKVHVTVGSPAKAPVATPAPVVASPRAAQAKPSFDYPDPWGSAGLFLD